MATREACLGTQIYGMFKATEIDGMFQLARIEKVEKLVHQKHRPSINEIPESFSSIMTAARDVSSSKDIRRSVIIEGLKGSGKTTVLRTVEKHLQKMKFTVISAECREVFTNNNSQLIIFRTKHILIHYSHSNLFSSKLLIILIQLT